LQLLTARTLNDYKLPDGYMCVAAINPSNDGYDTQELDPALLSRFIRITVEADAKEWLKWAESHGVHPAVTRFIRSTPDIFATPESNPRAWAWASDVLHAYERDGGGNDGLLNLAVSGLVGDALGTAMVQSHLNGEEPISADAILRDYDRHRRNVQEWTKAKKTDLIAASGHNLQVALQCVDLVAEIAKTEAMQQALGDFCSDIPADIGKRVRQAAKKAGALP